MTKCVATSPTQKSFTNSKNAHASSCEFYGSRTQSCLYMIINQLPHCPTSICETI